MCLANQLNRAWKEADSYASKEGSTEEKVTRRIAAPTP